MLYQQVRQDGANFEASVESLISRLEANPVPIQLPIGLEENHEGVVDLVEMKALYFDGEDGESVRVEDIPSNMSDDAEL